MKILMSGVTGLIGRALSQKLQAEGHRIIGLSRSPEKAANLPVEAMLRWEPEAGLTPAEAFDGIEAVIHLAGEPVADGRWTAERKQRIRNSRVISTRNLVEAMRSLTNKPRVFVAGSAVGIYGDRSDEVLDENAKPGTDFLADVCMEWEGEANRARELGIRTVEVRTGVVLAKEGGALAKMLPPFKLGIAGPLGSGNQYFPWIHLDDIVGLFEMALKNESLNRPLNGCAPEPVTNREFTRQLADALHRIAIIPVPEFALRLLYGEMAGVLLASQRVVPKVALDMDYQFVYPDLPSALKNLIT
jgi:uncharacterized protein (TIGR01777 family)